MKRVATAICALALLVLPVPPAIGGPQDRPVSVPDSIAAKEPAAPLSPDERTPSAPGTPAPPEEPVYEPAKTAAELKNLAGFAASAAEPVTSATPSGRSAPDFGDADKVITAWRDHRITEDELVRYGVMRLVSPKDLPETLRPVRPLGELAGSYQSFIFAHLSAAGKQTRAYADEAFTKHTADASGPPARGRTPVASAVPGDGDGDLPFDPQNSCGTVTTYMADSFACVYTAKHVRVYYNLETSVGDPDNGGYREPGLPPEFNRSADTPDALYKIVEALESAWSTYTSLGYDISLPAGLLDVWVGSAIPGDTAVVLPFEWPGEGHNATILIGNHAFEVGGNTNVPIRTQYSYLPRHELFHAFQYHYIGNADFARNLAATNWWMEATAEWAARRSFRDDPVFDGEVGEDGYYARNLNVLLGSPERALDSWDGFGSSRQYSENALAFYLTGQFGDDFVRRTWENYGPAGGRALDAVKATVAGYNRDTASLVMDYAVANYRLAPAAWVWLPQQQKWGRVAGYSDPHVPTVWRDSLTRAGGPSMGDMNGPARPARRSFTLGGSGRQDTTGAMHMELQPGGAAYVDIATGYDAANPVDRGLVDIHVDPDPRLRYTVLAWRPPGASGSVYPAIANVYDLNGQGDVQVHVDDPTQILTLVVARVDLVSEPVDAMGDVLTANWNASAIGDRSDVTAAVEGDPVAVRSDIPGQHVWVSVPVKADEAVYFAGVVRSAATLTLRSRTGAVWARDSEFSLNGEDQVRGLFTGYDSWSGTVTAGFYQPSADGMLTVELAPPPGGVLDTTLRVLSADNVPGKATPLEGAPQSMTTNKWGQRAMMGVSVPAGQSFYLAASLPAKAQQYLFGPNGFEDSWVTPGPGRFDIFAFPTVSVGGWYYLVVDLANPDAVDIDRGWEFRAFTGMAGMTMPTDGSKSEVQLSPWGRRGELSYAGFPGARVTMTASRKEGCAVLESAMTRAGIRDGSTSHWEPLPYNLDGEKVVFDEQPVGDMPPRILLLGMSCDATTYTIGLTLS